MSEQTTTTRKGHQGVSHLTRSCQGRWKKCRTKYTYDNVGNLKSIIYPQLTISYAYDALNRLTNMVDASGTNAFSYTPIGQLQNETGPWPNDTVSYIYNQELRTNLTLSEPGGSWSQGYGYDSAWRLTSLTSPAGTFGYNYNFQPASALVSSIGLPNGASVTNLYDSLARLTQTSLNNHWGHVLDGYAYTLDPLGLRTNVLRNFGLTSSSVSVGYDNIGQLTSWVASETNGIARLNEQLGFGFDAAHNLHSRVNGNLTQTFNADAENELTSVSRSPAFTLSGAVPASATNITINGQAAQIYGDLTFARTNLSLVSGNNTFTNVAQNVYGVTTNNTFTINLPSSLTLYYDNNGNLTNDGTRAFGYDSENRLTNVTVAGQWRSDFIYDGLSRRRIVKDYAWSSGWTETNETRYVYDGDLVIQERDINNNVLVTYTRGLDLSGDLWDAGGIGGLLARTDTNGSTFYHADGNGNITTLMDGNEDIVARYLYGPFSKLLGQWGALANANEMQFSSMPQHNGLTFYPFRAYEPNFQRWLNQDPAQELGGINLYRFSANDPLDEIDPLGLFAGSETVARTFEDVAANSAAEGNAGDEFGPLGWAVAAASGAALGLLGADDAQAYQIYQQDQQIAQGNQRIQQMEQELQHRPKTAPSAPPIKPPKPPCNNRNAKGFPGDENHEHHRLPKQFKNWFSAPPRNLNIENYKQIMPQQWHTGEDIGLHSNGYNDAWDSFINENPDATAAEVFQFLNYLENSMGFGISPE